MKETRIFIWQGGWKGGAEFVMNDIANFLEKNPDINVTIGVFKDELKTKNPLNQIYIKRWLPKKYVAYNNILASIFLKKKIRNFDLVITHTAGFWKNKSNLFLYREPGDLDALKKSLPFKSKLLYWLPHKIALYSIRKADLVVSASRRADIFLKRNKVNNFIKTTNFIDCENILNITERRILSQPIKIIFIGRDDPLKRLKLVQDSISSIKSNSIELHVFGVEGEDDENTKYHGWVEKNEVLKFLKDEAHIFILASLFEASPLSLLQSLSLGVPSLVIKESLPLELCDYVVSFEDKKSLTEELRKIKNNYKTYSETAYKKSFEIRDKFSKSKCLRKEFHQIFEDLSIFKK